MARSPSYRGTAANLRSPDGWSRRIADVADRGLGRLNWAGSGPTGIVSGRAGVRAKAVIPLQARNTLHRPNRKFPVGLGYGSEDKGGSHLEAARIAIDLPSIAKD